MPISMHWLGEDKTLIKIKFGGRILPAEVIAANVDFRAMLASVQHLVDVIIDPRRQVYFAPGYVQTAQAIRAGQYANLRSVVFVGATFAWELFVAYSRQYGGIAYRYGCAPSLSAAYEMVEQMRSGQTSVPPALVPDWN